MLRLVLAVAAAGAFCVPVQAANVISLCQVEISADEAPAPARRGETVGFIKRVDGQVKILRPKAAGFEEIDAVVGMDLYRADAVVTGSNGGFDAIFTDNSTVSGVADTCVEVSTYAYDAVQRSGDFQMRLGRGVISIDAGEVAKSGPGRMNVKIRNDTNLAVTGTRIAIRAK